MHSKLPSVGTYVVIHKLLCDALSYLNEPDIQMNSDEFIHTVLQTFITGRKQKESDYSKSLVLTIQGFFSCVWNLFSSMACIEDFAVFWIYHIKSQLMSVEVPVADKGGMVNRSAVHRKIIF